MHTLKSCSMELTLVTIFFATNIFERITTEANQAHINQDQPWLWPGEETSLITKMNYEHYVQPRPTEIYPEVQKPEFKKTGRRISETKCLEYIWERNNRENVQREDTWDSTLFSRDDRGCAEIGGREALQDEFPHMGALGWRTVQGSWIFKCGSSLISPKFTVTAAHCSKIKKDGTIAKRKPEIVRLGENNIIDVYANPIDADILRIIVHPRYSSPKKYYDIALVELKSELQFSSNVQPVCLWNSFNMSRLGSEVSSTGWGVVNTATKLTSPTLQATVIDVIDSEQCDRLLRRYCNRRWCGLQEHQLCAGKLSGGVDACQGDSGGPLQVKINLPSSEGGTMHYLVGVTSFGIGCARPNLPGVYTRVSSFVDWIESIVWPEQNNGSTDYDFEDSDEKPCEPQVPIIVNTSAPGRRISEEKCFEYIAQMESREREEKANERCRAYLIQQIKKGVVPEIFIIIRSRVVFGGRPAHNKEFPHMGALGWRARNPSDKWVFKCGSTLISEKFIITAAHCSKLSLRRVSDIVKKQPEIVRLGVTDISDDEFRRNGFFTDMKIKRIIVHPKYAPPKQYFDIALIELESEVKFKGNLQPACLWTEQNFNDLGNVGTLTGWGKTEKGHSSELLQTATVSLIETPQCEQLLRPYRNRNWRGFQDHQMCVGKLTGGVDSCQGDSGGPFQMKIPLQTVGKMYWILGVTAFGLKCGHTNRPGIYTRVASFIDWIEENVWNSTK